MTPEQFTHWLQGYSEISGDQPTKEQWQVIKDHLQTVFHKVTPDYYPQTKPLEITPNGTGTPPWIDSTKIIC